MIEALADLGLKHYKWAEVRLVTYVDKNLDRPRLIFSTVTLYPDFVPKPEPMQGVIPSTNTKLRLYFRRVVMRAEQAIEWYGNLSDSSKTPLPHQEGEIEDKYDNKDFLCPNLLNEMEWPSLGMPLKKPVDQSYFKTFKPAPFIGETNSRIHRKFGDVTGLMHIFDDEKTLDFIERCTHINLKHYQEYLASACLVVPNPLVQKVDNFLIQKDGSEVVFHRFVARPNKSLEGLTITIHEENNNLSTLIRTQKIPKDGIVELERPKCMGEYSYQVVHDKYGLILNHEPTGFLRSVSLSAGIVEKQFSVTTPINTKKNAKTKTYTSNQVSTASENIVGAENAPHNFNARVALAGEQRRLKAVAEENNQKFFSADSREEAIDFIHEIIRKAKRKILIADPYFSHLQDVQFLYAVNNASVKIEIVTSQLAFSGKEEEIINKSKLLAKSLEKSEKETGRNITAKVLKGEKPILHDRFLIVDNNVWFMGNSLSDIGQRASMILKVPYPKAVIEQILLIQKQAVELDEFIRNKND